MRRATIKRKTAETDIRVEIDLDGTGNYDNRTGVGFFDHMLDQLARHALIDMTVRAEGDLHIDDHHTVEDVGLALGQALAQAAGDKRGIRRYGSCLLPMDDALVRAALDLSGRPFLVWSMDLPTPKIGTFDTELVREFFNAFAMQSGLTLHVEALAGVNSHHMAEAAFKAVARALRDALETDPRKADAVPSTKGTLSK
ncbi:MAG: imidazoleglycerol-phosphate dehydratase HisB [Pseudomonadota bacterium]